MVKNSENTTLKVTIVRNVFNLMRNIIWQGFGEQISHESIKNFTEKVNKIYSKLKLSNLLY